MGRNFGFSAVLFLLTAAAPGWAVTPMEYYHSLVAGGDEAGFRDGAFVSARFQGPLGLAFDDTGRRLYVADSGNHRIRVVDLDRDNEVRTLAGKDLAGSVDGPFPEATFVTPVKLATLPDGRLAVFDAGNASIRLVDLRNQRVSTLARGIHLRDMTYDPQHGSLYFSEADQVRKLDLKSSAISTFLSADSKLPSPGALCLHQGLLCVADSRLPMVYEVTPLGEPSSGAASVSLSTMGKAEGILALASSDGVLYALRQGGLLVRVGFPSTEVRFPTPWGFLMDNQDHEGDTALFKTAGDIPIGFSTSPIEPRKFYVASEHSIVNVKDYDFEAEWGAFKDNDSGLTDFTYPFRKPSRTFRILMIGTSRNSTAVPLPPDPSAKIDESVETPRVLTFSKRLELVLNTEAALQNLDIHFEVLNLTQRGHPIPTYGYYEIPRFVQKYGIDLVLALADQTGYKDYYERPITPEGIPAASMDYEYMLKPLPERATSRPAKDLIERCRALKIPVSDKQDYPGDGYWSLFCNGDVQMQKDLREMAGQRLWLLNQKLGHLKTEVGRSPRLVFYFVPGGALPNDCAAAFWRDACSQYHLDFFDLSESFNALKTSYDPVYVDHFTAYGNELVALLLGRYLIEKKLVPF